MKISNNKFCQAKDFHGRNEVPRYFSFSRLDTILSKPLKAPDETKRMFVVSTLKNQMLIKAVLKMIGLNCKIEK
jgi:hypothetical protein